MNIKFTRLSFHHSYLRDIIFRQTRLVAYINTFARLDNMLHVVDLQNIFNPFNGTLIERKQDTWSFLKTKKRFSIHKEAPLLVYSSHLMPCLRIVYKTISIHESSYHFIFVLRLLNWYIFLSLIFILAMNVLVINKMIFVLLKQIHRFEYK